MQYFNYISIFHFYIYKYLGYFSCQIICILFVINDKY